MDIFPHSSQIQHQANERVFNTVRAHLFKWPDPFTPFWMGSIMSPGGGGRGTQQHGPLHKAESNARPCLRRSGENARARGLFSRASLTRNVTLLNLEPRLFFPFLSVELIFRCLDTFTVKWVTSKSKQKSWRETDRAVEDAERDKGTIKSLAEHVQLIKCSYHQKRNQIVRPQWAWGKCFWIYLKVGNFTDTYMTVNNGCT